MKKIISRLTILAIPLGILFGVFLPKFCLKISFIGTIYINILKFMVIPLIFLNISYTIYKALTKKEKIITKSIGLFILMFVVTFLITSLIIFIIKPNFTINLENFKWDGESVDLNFTNIITNIFPDNIISPFANNSLFTIILLALLFGYSSSKVKNIESVMEDINGLSEILKKMLEIILYLNPLAAFTLIASSVANYKLDIILMGIKYILIAYLCSIIIMFIVMMLPVWICKKINPITYIKNCGKVWLMTITSCSSLATLPLTLKTCTDNFKIPKSKNDIVVSLGCAINFCGGAVSFAILGLLCSKMFGIEISALNFVLMLLTALVINMAAPGIPNGGVVIGATYLSLFKIPLDFIGFYSGLYKILDMAYTTLNVTGDITASILLNKKNS